MTDGRRPVHLAVLAGLSVSAYAGSLALVTVLQSSADGALIAERAPVRAAADAIRARHDGLDAVVAAAVRRYDEMSDRYGALLPGIVGMEASLDTLARTTAGVTDSTLAMPTHISLPSIQAAPRVIRVAAPATQATTGASGR